MKQPAKPPKKSSYSARSGKKYLAFFKPYAVLTQFTLPDNSQKETLSKFHFPKDVYPLGRLDFDSEGLLMLSDDGGLNKFLLDPSAGHDRVYLAQVENVPTQAQLDELQQGVLIQGERTLPCRAELIEGEPALPERPVPIRFRQEIPTAWVKLTLSEGKNRQVRRMTAAVGCPTLRLVRVAIGQLNIYDLALKPGKWLELKPEQLQKAFQPSTVTIPRSGG